jgi:DNA repair exonuclease SbcCD nuclease subunit
MKILITSDLHIEEGIYTDICINYLDFIMDYCKKNKITHIIIAGDIFEKSTKIKNESFLPLFFKFMELKNSGFVLYFILGNHDIFNVDNDSLIEAFSPFGNVIKKFEEIEIDDRIFSFLPYTKREEDIPSSGDILITHLSIADFTFDNKYHVNEKAGFPIEKFDGFNIVFTGHFHRPQNKKSIVYMGSPYQLNFGEIGQEKGFVVFDCKTGDWNRINYTGSPVYIKIKANDFNIVDVKNAFVQVEIEEKIDNYVQLKHLLYERGALEVTPFFVDVSSDISIKETDLNLNSGVVDMMKEYINNLSKIDDIENEKLIELFEKVLES